MVVPPTALDFSTSSTSQELVVQHLPVLSSAPRGEGKAGLLLIAYGEAGNTVVGNGWIHAYSLANAIKPSPRTAKFSTLFATIGRLRGLAAGWDAHGAPAPNATAAAFAKMVLDECESNNFVPASVLSSSDGGIAITFREGVRYADIECFNEGELYAAFHPGEGIPSVWPVDGGRGGIRAAIEEIKDRFGR
jgi:hypothetical protein